MKTPDEIKNGLECCTYVNAHCESCPFRTGTSAKCIRDMSACAIAYIQQLEHYIGELTEKVAQLEEECDLLIADLRKAYEELLEPPKEVNDNGKIIT